ncbi:pyrroline 5 carboxylate reductase [Trichuris trichiura]|uniref:Pyrroline-5-carboxylate reductase n=1 Tax=Trichuris trichiura TaxID=36087 RepID=A0A077YWM6_TRITR|nr:pyrroline 5 carboxylate reductase [Trichuris trichiura]
MLLSKITVGFIGAGNIAQALVCGMIASGLFFIFSFQCTLCFCLSHSGKLRANQLSASAPQWDTVNLDKMKKMNIRTTSDNAQVVNESEVILLAVKPSIVREVCNEIQWLSTPANEKLLVSLAAGVSIADIEQFCPAGYRVARVMPNTAVAVMEGTSLFCLGRTCKPEDFKLIEDMFSSVGYALQVPEQLFDAAVGLSGCGPAYMYLTLEALAEGAVKLGLTRDVALKLAAHTMRGAATMVIETGTHPGVLREAVESPGGATVCGVHELEKHAYRSALICAVEAAAMKSAQLVNKTKNY